MSNKRIASQLNWNLQSSIEQLWKRRNLAGNHRQCCAIVGYLETFLWNNPPTSAFKFNKSAKHLPPSGHWIVSQNSRFCEIYEHLFRKIFESRLLTAITTCLCAFFSVSHFWWRIFSILLMQKRSLAGDFKGNFFSSEHGQRVNYMNDDNPSKSQLKLRALLVARLVSSINKLIWHQRRRT